MKRFFLSLLFLLFFNNYSLAADYEVIWFNPDRLLFSHEKKAPGRGYYKILFDNENRQIIRVVDARLVFPGDLVPEFNLTDTEQKKLLDVERTQASINYFNQISAERVAREQENLRIVREHYEKRKPERHRELAIELGQAKEMTTTAEGLLKEGKLLEAASYLRLAQAKFKRYVKVMGWDGVVIKKSAIDAINRNQLLTKQLIEAAPLAGIKPPGRFITKYFQDSLPKSTGVKIPGINPVGILKAP